MLTKKVAKLSDQFDQAVDALKKLTKKKEELTQQEIALLNSAAKELPRLYQKLTTFITNHNYRVLAATPPLSVKPEGANERKRRIHALNCINAAIPGVTIIQEHEKIQVYETDDIQKKITPKLLVVIKELNSGIRYWRGNTTDSHIHQLNEIIHYSFYFDNDTPRREDEINYIIENILCHHHRDIF